MVYFYESVHDGTVYYIISGKNKNDNDHLIKWSFAELNYFWFHVNDYSSAHIYLKCPSNIKEVSDIPDVVLQDCLQLCKAQSIVGNKLPQCTIIITPWNNLRKNRFMAPGEVSFKTTKKLRKRICYSRDNKIINRLLKTRVSLLNVDIEQFLQQGKKSKDPEFWVKYLIENRESLLQMEKDLKLSKRQTKKKLKNQEVDFYNKEMPTDEQLKLIN